MLTLVNASKIYLRMCVGSSARRFCRTVRGWLTLAQFKVQLLAQCRCRARQCGEREAGVRFIQ